MNDSFNQPPNPANRRPRRRRRSFSNQSQGGQNNQGRSGGGNRNRNNRNRGQRRSNAQFVGPMDHSYRNQGNGAGGQGRFRNGFGGGQTASELEPLPPREDAPTRIFAFVDDLFFLAKIQEVGRKLNVKVEFVKSQDEIADKMGETEDKPSLVIVDLNSNSIKPLSVISKLKSRFKKTTSIVGFLSHVQGDLKVKAQEAGCDVVMPRSAFSQTLPSLLRRHGAHEEAEDNFNKA